jgi:hypothetical protein
MLKYYTKKLIPIPEKLGNKLAMFYENWLIPPQNESLIEIKRKEFKERTRYLEPSILYNLTEEEKVDLRNQGYFVDLNEKTLKEIKDFKLSFNRHLGKYRVGEYYDNFAYHNTKYYYTDQNDFNFRGDPYYYNKIWRNRTFVKNKIFNFLMAYLILYAFYRYRLKQHTATRKKIKKLSEQNPNILIPVENLA